MEFLELSPEGWKKFLGTSPNGGSGLPPELQDKIDVLDKEFAAEQRVGAFKLSMNQDSSEHVQRCVEIRMEKDHIYSVYMKDLMKKYPKTN